MAVWKWELIGVLFILSTGSVLHFVFEWVHHWRLLAWVAPVNESTWEHFKLGFWPGLMFALVEYVMIRESVSNFWIGKSLGLLSMPIVIGTLFYGYTAIVGRHYLWVDIWIFLVSVAVAQGVSYRIMTAAQLGGNTQRWGIIGLMALVVVYSLFSYYPPRVFLFEDPVTHHYGILDTHGE
jgi:hypothetical protein